MRKRNRPGRAVHKNRYRLLVGGLAIFERPLVMEPLEERLALAVDLGIEPEEIVYANPLSATATEFPGDAIFSDGARLNDVIDGLLNSFDKSDLPTGEDATFTSFEDEIPDMITVGTTPAGGADLELQNLTLTFSGLSYASDQWSGEVLVESTSGALIPEGLDIAISDSDDNDLSAVFGTIQLAPGDNSSFLDLDSVSGADIWPSLRWLVTEIEDLRLTFDDFRAERLG